ncbi:MAG TPA: hypothetical protein VGL81_05950 [Polyangiaceae bacterium]|jgi:hypothetical protein
MTLQSLFGIAALGTMTAVAACGGGGGPLVTTTSSTGRDDPGSTYDQPPSTDDSAGGNCLSCDVSYNCPNAGDVGEGLGLSTSDGTCTQALINVVCSGALFGTAPCSSDGAGGFTCGNVTCTPEPNQGSGSSSGVATPGSSSGGNGFADAG